jgi:hypothetical protein
VLALVLSLSAFAAPPPIAAEPHRWLLESEVHLPLPMWLAARQDHEARVLGWKLQLAIDCGAGSEQTRQITLVQCPILAASLSVAPYAPDVGVLDRWILPEVNGTLAHSTVSLGIDGSGHLVSVDLDGPVRNDVRSTAIAENLRLIVGRAVAGLDLPLDASTRAWPQYQPSIAALPDARGNSAGVEIVHQAAGTDASLEVTSAGRGSVILPLGPNVSTGAARSAARESRDVWSLQLASQATFEEGLLVARRWTATGEATASSPSGPDYVQKGTANLLKGEPPPLSAPVETALDGVSTGTLLTTDILGEDPAPRLR